MAGRHRAGRVTETSDYAAFTMRVLNGYGDRVADDPAALVHLRDLEQALADAVNRGIFEANRRKRYSTRQIGAILGVSHVAIVKRAALGELVLAAQIERRGGGGLFRLGDMRRRRAAALQAAGVPDLTGSEKERALRAVV